MLHRFCRELLGACLRRVIGLRGAYELMESVANKTYGQSACAEAMSDIDSMIATLDRLRSSHRHVDERTDCEPPHGAELSTSVRQLVTDSKHLVAGALTAATDRETRLRAGVETAMHTLAAVVAQSCRLLTAADPPAGVGDVTDCVLEAARSLRSTVEAAGRAVVEPAAAAARSDPGETDRRRNTLLGTAAVLAKSLSVLVQKVKTV